MSHRECSRLAVALLTTASLLESRLSAQALENQPNVAATASDDSSAEAAELVVLNPFTVSTDRDRGYKATNVTTGTRLDSAIKDTALALEVITADFIRDTGATTLREALRYSAGVQLQSQNDYAGNGFAQYEGPGGVNNPEMRTADPSDTTIVLRGFTTANALRDGFRRKVSTDAINIERVEVVRGPSALLYGTGNFGGVVNYIPKSPAAASTTAATFTFGSHGLVRGTVDATGPFASGKAGYRLTAAAQQSGDYTDFYDLDKLALGSVFTYRPWHGTEFTVDAEYGRSESSGIGFQSIRARADVLGNRGGMEHAGLIAFPSEDLRTMRWSGPDTHLDTRQFNLELKATQHLAEGLDLLVAYNRSDATFDRRDITASVGNNIGPIALWATLYPVPLDASRGDTDANWAAAPVAHSIIAYSWDDTRTVTGVDQARAELSYRFKLLESRPWLTIDNSLLAGVSTERDHTTGNRRALDSAAGVYNWKSVADPTPFRFDTQGDGSASLPQRLRQRNEVLATETGVFAAYQGRFLKGKLTLLGGIRRDRDSVSTDQIGYRYADGAVDAAATNSASPPRKSYTTTQIGASLALHKTVSLYALRAEGLTPNFTGARDLTGTPMDAVKAVNLEYGLKFDLLDGRVSGTVSRYRITRRGQPNASFWWGPQTAVRNFDPDKPVVYNLTDLNPDAAQVYRYNDNSGNLVPLIQWNNNYAYWGDLSGLTAVPAGAAGSSATAEGLRSYQTDGLNGLRTTIQTTWTAAKAAGAVSYWDRSGNAIDETAFASLVSAGGPSNAIITLNASTAQGAAYMDALYGYFRAAGLAHPGSDNWPGWFFNSAPASTGYNSAAQDTNSFANTPALSAPESDRNTGWDGQLIITPVDDWQILVSFEKNDHTILSLGQFPDYPGQTADRWAPWMFPNGQWGLSGYYAPNEQYTDEERTSTFSFKGLIHPGAQGMDYPKWSWSVFTSLRLTRLGLKNLKIGGGVIRTGPQEYASGFTHAGDALKDSDGEPLVLYTRTRTTVNLFARYEFALGRRQGHVQLNVENVLDDQSRYGLLWAPGCSARLELGTSF
ncbi:MAG TPA: TonB-dependent receptor plug domain-containing protein [Opitutaceae bacterium]|nr:TonB-dependent receptor plug domain-containing protein [Opitutaceae bacterium]